MLTRLLRLATFTLAVATLWRTQVDARPAADLVACPCEEQGEGSADGSGHDRGADARPHTPTAQASAGGQAAEAGCDMPCCRRDRRDQLHRGGNPLEVPAAPVAVLDAQPCVEPPPGIAYPLPLAPRLPELVAVAMAPPTLRGMPRSDAGPPPPAEPRFLTLQVLRT